MHQIQISSGRVYQAEGNESLLDAALRQGLVLGHSCKTGRCSSCKARVLSGDSVATQDELGLTPDERAKGFVLSCVRQARSDLRLEVEDLGSLHLFPSKILPARIQGLQGLGPDVMQVTLRLPPGPGLAYHPGQYIDVIGPAGLRRSYSLANAPRDDRTLELHIRAVPGGAMSEYWFEQAKVNDLLRLEGPLGTFFLREAAGRDVVMLATGTGIAPVKAMLEGLLHMEARQLPASVRVLWGARRLEELYWDPTELGLPLHFEPVLSRAPAEWVGARGHVQDVLIAQGRALQNAWVYACGSEKMIHAARSRLIGEGLPERQFHADAFVCSSRGAS